MLFLLFYLNLSVLSNSPVAHVAHISHGRKETGQKYESALAQVSSEVASEDATLHEMVSTETK